MLEVPCQGLGLAKGGKNRSAAHVKQGLWRGIRRHGPYWWVVGLVALFELVALGVIRHRVPRESDWQRAARTLRHSFRSGDLVVAAPAWADPWLRHVLADRLPLEAAGRSDLAPYRRLWALSIRGARPAEAPATPPEFAHRFGPVTLLRWALPKDEKVIFDLTSALERAEVVRLQAGEALPCPLQEFPFAMGGGLGGGPMAPRRRFVCDPARPWLWVAPSVLEDEALQPRYCVWQHPAGPEPIRVRLPKVPLGDRLVLYGGLYYEHAHFRESSPVELRLLVDGEERRRIRYAPGEGWKRSVIEWQSRDRYFAEGDVEIEVKADNPHFRGFCWAATTRVRMETPRAPTEVAWQGRQP